MANSKQDAFLNESNGLDRQLGTLKADIKTRETDQKKGKDNPILNRTIQQQINAITNKLNTLSGIVAGWDSDPQDLPKDEIDRRRKRVNDYKNEL